MTLVPLKIPAGFYRTGTDLDGSGRYMMPRDAHITEKPNVLAMIL